jgi:hypothetical protein
VTVATTSHGGGGSTGCPPPPPPPSKLSAANLAAARSGMGPPFSPEVIATLRSLLAPTAPISPARG